MVITQKLFSDQNSSAGKHSTENAFQENFAFVISPVVKQSAKQDKIEVAKVQLVELKHISSHVADSIAHICRGRKERNID